MDQPQTTGPEVVGQRALFDYGALDQETQVLVRLRAGEIKSLAKRVAADIVEIGGKLAEVKDRVGGNGKFNDWLSAELGWSERTAYNFIAVWTRFGAANFALENVATSALYLLAAPSTPAEAVEVARQIADSGEEVTHGVAKEIVRQAKERRPKQKELIDEPASSTSSAGADEAASTAVAAEEPRRPMDQLVATVKRFSGRIVGSTLVNQGFTFGQVTEALDRKLIEKRDSLYLWHVEPAEASEDDGDGFRPGFPPGFDTERAEQGLAQTGAVDPSAICLCGCKAGDHTREDGEFAECTKCECEVFQRATEADIAERQSTEKALGIGGAAAPGAKASPAPVSAHKPAASKRPAAWFKSRIEINITLMPCDGPDAQRKVLHSVRAGDDTPFVGMSSDEADSLDLLLPIKTCELLAKLTESLAKKPTAKPAAKPAKKPTVKSKPAAKKPAAKTKAKGGKK